MSKTVQRKRCQRQYKDKDVKDSAETNMSKTVQRQRCQRQCRDKDAKDSAETKMSKTDAETEQRDFNTDTKPPETVK